MQACPYGAIMERSKIIDIHKSISNPKKKIVAIPAPAIYGQFNATPGQVLAAIKQIGFDDVIEVALGAEITAANEAKELEEKMQEGQAFMTTSCCPAYTGWVDKHAPMRNPMFRKPGARWSMQPDTRRRNIRMPKSYSSDRAWPNAMKPIRSTKWIM